MVFIRIDDGRVTGDGFGQNALAGGFIAVPDHSAPLFPDLAADNMNDGWLVIVIDAVAWLLVGASPWRIVAVGMRPPFFPGVLVEFIHLEHLSIHHLGGRSVFLIRHFKSDLLLWSGFLFSEVLMTKVLLIDRSGRGHAFADLFSRTNKDVRVYYAPGCSAINTERITSLPHLSLSDHTAMIDFAKQENIDFVMVTNAVALANGFIDVLKANNIIAIGPDRQASLLESSKSYGKQMCAKYGIPVATFCCFDNPDSAKSYVKNVPYQVVVKADGLCGGNGSFVCESADDAMRAIDKLMTDREFGEAGDKVVIEKRLFGREISFFALTDGVGFKMLPMSLDYPKSDDGNRGITCGGMGALSPHPLESGDLLSQAETQILRPLMECIRKERLNYKGVVYLGCMLVEDRLYVLEINVRMGDPEAEVVLPRIESDFVEVCKSIINQTLHYHTENMC